RREATAARPGNEGERGGRGAAREDAWPADRLAIYRAAQEAPARRAEPCDRKARILARNVRNDRRRRRRCKDFSVRRRSRSGASKLALARSRAHAHPRRDRKKSHGGGARGPARSCLWTRRGDRERPRYSRAATL